MSLFDVLFELLSAYGTNGLTMGSPARGAALSAEYGAFSKVVQMAVMLLGRHRHMPTHTDAALDRHVHRLQGIVRHLKSDLERKRAVLAGAAEGGQGQASAGKLARGAGGSAQQLAANGSRSGRRGGGGGEEAKQEVHELIAAATAAAAAAAASGVGPAARDSSGASGKRHQRTPSAEWLAGGISRAPSVPCIHEEGDGAEDGSVGGSGRPEAAEAAADAEGRGAQEEGGPGGGGGGGAAPASNAAAPVQEPGFGEGKGPGHEERPPEASQL